MAGGADAESGGVNQAITDALTGAYSRALMDSRLAEEVERATRSGAGCSVFLFDVDYFKSVNDAYGHGRGDDVLRQLVERINGLVRGYDVLFRYGGDEFVLLLPDTLKADAVGVALRLAQGVRETPYPGDPPLTVSVSVGVASFPDDGVTAEELLAAADRRNYLAKRRGRACAVSEDVEASGKIVSSRLLERDSAMLTAREFVSRLFAERRGALHVTGDPGAGQTRFLEEVAKLARLRGFDVQGPGAVEVPAGDTPRRQGVLVFAEDGEETAACDLVERLVAEDGADARVIGLVYATSGRSAGLAAITLPILDTVELLPWSSSALRVWLRTVLQGEPTRPLVDWMARRSGGLPARAERELSRLLERSGIEQTATGGWTISADLAPARAVRSRIPVPLADIIGRDREIAQVTHLLTTRRLVTLAGPGGIGKTRLALAAAGAAEDSFDDGAAFVPLAEARTAERAVSAIGQALGVGEVAGQPLVETIAAHLADRRLLLVLDNFEQVIAAVPVVSELLAAAPGLTVLVTSRERLRVYGEQLYQVPPLALPDLAALPTGPGGVAEVLAGSPAVALFVARAQAASYDFELTPATLPVVAQLCHRLDGLPLAIELAAGRSDELPPERLLADLTSRLDLLGDGPLDLPTRQQTLRAAIDWSFTLLTPAEQRMLARLGAFTGGCGLDAVRAVSGADCPEVERTLAALVDRNLLRAEPDRDSVRYSMLETIRDYAVDRLREDPDAEGVHVRHAGHYAGFAAEAGQGLTGPDQAYWASAVAREYGNLRAALGESVERGDAVTAARIGTGLWRFWRNGTHISEGREWLNRVLCAADPLTAALRPQVLHAAAVLATAQDDYTAAGALAEESLRGADRAGDRATMAQALNALGITALGAGDPQQARAYFEDSLRLWREQDGRHGMAIALGNLTKVSLKIGDMEAASGYASASLELDRAAGNTRGILLGLGCLGQIRLAQDDPAGARPLLEESLTLSRELGDVFGEAMALHYLGLVAAAAGDPVTALRLVTSALALRRDVGDREDLASSLESLAGLLDTDDPALAARLLGAAEELRERHELPRSADARPAWDAVVARLKATLAEDMFAAAWTAGQAAPLDAVVDEALAFAP